MSKTVPSPLGVLHTEFVTFTEPLPLESGKFLAQVTVAYQTYGKLNSTADNVVLVCHALSGDAHVAGNHAEDNRLGWWEIMVGKGKPLDTEQYFIVCSNVLGGCKGTTGPVSLNPATGQPYALSFPVVTIEDMVRLQKRLLDFLGVNHLHAVIGGSMGGMQALSWAVQYPDFVSNSIPIATAPALTAQGIAWDEIGRRAIMADVNWNNGNYYAPGHARPQAGLAVARMVGHVTYLSEGSMEQKFGRRLRHKEQYSYGFDIDFEIESYLAYQSAAFNARFDPNSYLYITRAMDYFDLSSATGDLVSTFARTTAHFLIISFSSDWLYPPIQSERMLAALRAAGREDAVEYLAATAPYGHDSFLLDAAQQGPMISQFLSRNQ